jgi:hypothetical protein
MPTHTDPPALTPEQRSALARVAAHVLHSQVDPTAHTEPARRAFLSRLEREVDPERKLTPAERSRRAEHAKKAYFGRLSFKSAAARRQRKGGGEAA